MKTARFIKKMADFRGDARLYACEPPMPTPNGTNGGATAYVIVSAAVVPLSGAETYIFACNEDGSSIDWAELEGSSKGHLSHTEALAGAGYGVTS